MTDLFIRFWDFFRSLDFREGFKFIVSILTLYTLFWFGLRVVGLGALRRFTAQATSGLLNFVGVGHSISFEAVPMIMLAEAEGVKAAVTDLCVGDLELALLPAIVLSTFDRSLKRRLVGVVSGVLLILLVNPLRIFIVLWTASSFGWGLAEFMHGFSFRLVLILIILGFYYIWYLKYDSVANFISGRLNGFKTMFKPRSQS